MPSLLSNVPISDEQRINNDQHSPWVVALVLAILIAYAYLFTHAADLVGAPRPAQLAEQMGVVIDQVFDSDQNVDSAVVIPYEQRLESNDDERLALYLVIIAAFICVYFLPLRHKQTSLALWTAVALLTLYGVTTTAGLVFAHLLVYLVLHPHGKQNFALSLLAGAAAFFAFVDDQYDQEWGAALLVGLPILFAAFYQKVLLKILSVDKFAPLLRTAVIQSAILTVCFSAVIEGLSGDKWSLPLGILLFFWQWERLIMYHIDYKDGPVPRDLSFSRYIAVFFNPAVLPNWNWGVTIGQGYSYLNDNFLCENKNKIVLSGVKILAIALLYLIFSNWLIHTLSNFFEGLGIRVYEARTREMVRYFVAGDDIGTLNVLLTTFLDLLRWTTLWAGVVHFKVGIWRICGYRMAPYIDKPWASTNLVTLWSRFTYHYREFLVRAFYYPVFFRFFRDRPYLRVFTATMAAAAIGNLVWGHVTERIYYRGMEWENVVFVLGTWPYFVLLGLGIGFTQIYLMWRTRLRKPWTIDRWLVTDIIAAYLTLQYYALIHIFARPVSGSSVGDLTSLFLRGFGIQ